MAGDHDDDDDALASLSRNLGELGRSLPQLVDQLRAAAALRGEPLPPSVPDRDVVAARFATFGEYLRRFGRADDARPAPLALGPVVDEVLALLRPELERHARLVDTRAPTPAVLATPRRVAQILLNLLVNAAQAIAAGGGADHRIEVRLASDERGWAVLEVEDSGPGMSEELLARVFDPFFSTKRGAGKGLGLPLSRELCAELGGALQVYSTVGKGTRVRIELPPAEVR